MSVISEAGVVQHGATTENNVPSRDRSFPSDETEPRRSVALVSLGTVGIPPSGNKDMISSSTEKSNKCVGTICGANDIYS
jgi:hypothetical protein